MQDENPRLNAVSDPSYLCMGHKGKWDGDAPGRDS